MCLGVRCVVVCCVVALCFGALGLTLVCRVRYRCSVLCVVVCRLAGLYNTLCCAPLFCRWSGVAFRAVGFVVVCCVSALCGVVVLSCWLRYVAPLWCHVALLGDVLWRGSSRFSRFFVVACSLWCFVVPRCVVVIGVVWCLGMCFVSVHGVVALLCGVVRWCEPCMCVRDTQHHVLLPCVGSRSVVPLVLRHVRRVLHSVMPFTSVGSAGRAIPLGMLAMDMGSRGCTSS